MTYRKRESIYSNNLMIKLEAPVESPLSPKLLKDIVQKSPVRISLGELYFYAYGIKRPVLKYAYDNERPYQTERDRYIQACKASEVTPYSTSRLRYGYNLELFGVEDRNNKDYFCQNYEEHQAYAEGLIEGRRSHEMRIDVSGFRRREWREIWERFMQEKLPKLTDNDWQLSRADFWLSTGEALWYPKHPQLLFNTPGAKGVLQFNPNEGVVGWALEDLEAWYKGLAQTHRIKPLAEV